MDAKALVELIRKYPEWQDDLDETACPTGFVSCPICDGGGMVSKVRGIRGVKPPVHKPDCPRAQFEKEFAAG